MPYRELVANADETSVAKRAAVIFNPIKVDEARLKEAVASAAEAAGWAETEWFETSVDDAGQLVTAEAVASGADVVMAAGGDGTVRAVAEGLRGTGIPLALLPSGTGNLLARNLELNLNFDEGIQTMFDGHDRRIDLGLMEITRPDGEKSKHVFLVVAGLGIDAKMIANTNPDLKKAVGWLAYVDGTLRSLPDLHSIKMKVSIDREPWRQISAHSVMAGNCGQLTGGIVLIPDAVPDDGILDFMAIRPDGPFGWLKVWNRVAIENGVLRKTAVGRKILGLGKKQNDVVYRQGTDLRLDLDEVQEIQLDGDEFGEATELHIWIDPGALTVRVSGPVEAVDASADDAGEASTPSGTPETAPEAA